MEMDAVCGELIPYTSASQLGATLPEFGEQFEYFCQLSALHTYSRDPRYRVAEIEAQCAMADSIKKAIKKGDVKAVKDERGHKVYRVDNLSTSDIHTSEVDRWRKLRAVPAKQRSAYYGESKRASREGLLKWWRHKNKPAPPDNSGAISKVPGIQLFCGDCLELMRDLETDSVDLVFGSPPYENARTYGIDYQLTGEAWVNWMFDRVVESLRISHGLVAFVVEGRTVRYRWSATPVLLMARLHEAGYHLRKPVIYKRQGTPGAGGPDWLRNDYEFVICCTNGGKLPWAENTACGTMPKWDDEGGHRIRNADGTFTKGEGYKAPELVNPGNIVECVAGGGNMGSNLCHENEAPFPEKLAELFVRSFCRHGGTVLDPFCGSGTTLAVARRYGRESIGIDIRQSQIDLTNERLSHEQTKLIT